LTASVPSERFSGKNFDAPLRRLLTCVRVQTHRTRSIHEFQQTGRDLDIVLEIFRVKVKTLPLFSGKPSQL
jgi:hypothetical protein